MFDIPQAMTPEASLELDADLAHGMREVAAILHELARKCRVASQGRLTGRQISMEAMAKKADEAVQFYEGCVAGQVPV